MYASLFMRNVIVIAMQAILTDRVGGVVECYIRVIIIEKVSNAHILCIIIMYSLFLSETTIWYCYLEVSLQALGLVSYHDSYLM